MGQTVMATMDRDMERAAVELLDLDEDGGRRGDQASPQ
jgi:hypothetical protein